MKTLALGKELAQGGSFAGGPGLLSLTLMPSISSVGARACWMCSRLPGDRLGFGGLATVRTSAWQTGDGDVVTGHGGSRSRPEVDPSTVVLC
jgi:hypothetical protein